MNSDRKIPASRPPAPPPIPPPTMDSSVNAFPQARPMHGRTSGPTRRSTRGQWTHEEDEILRAAVQRFKGKNWKKIAECFKDRTDVQCLHRWQKVLNPDLIKGPWSKEEDEIIVQMVKKYGPKKWSTIAQHLPGRIGKQCRERWHNHLNPDIKKEAWTQEEEIVLIHAHELYGNKWAELTKYLPGRTDNAIKNHWNSSVKKKLDSYKASGLLAQFPGLPSVINQNQSITMDGAEGEENSESSQVGCSQAQSDMSNAGFLTSEDFIVSEESEQGKMQSTSATPSCSEQYYTLDDMTFTIPDIPCEFTISSNYLEEEFSEDVRSNPRDCNFGAIDAVDYYLPAANNSSVPGPPHNSSAPVDSCGTDPNVAQHTLKTENGHSQNLLPSEEVDMERYTDYMTLQSIYQFCEAGGAYNQLSASVLDASHDDNPSSIPSDISGQNGLTINDRKVVQINDGVSNNDNSSSIPSGISSQQSLTMNDKKVGQINDDFPATQGQEFVSNPEEGYVVHTNTSSPCHDPSNAGVTVETELLDSLRLGPEDKFISEISDDLQRTPPRDGQVGTLCYEPPRFPSLDIPFFSCDLAQPGTDAQQDFSPLGIRQLMMSSASSLTPFKLWDSPSSDESPDALLRSAAKTFACTPSILKKRHRDLLSPLSPFSERRYDKKKGNDARQGFLCAPKLTKEFSCLDVIFDEAIQHKESASSSNDPAKPSKVTVEEDKENVCPVTRLRGEAGQNQDFEAKTPEKDTHGNLLNNMEKAETTNSNCGTVSYDDSASEMPRGVLVDHHLNDPDLLSPGGIRTSVRPSEIDSFKYTPKESDSDLPFGDPGFFVSPPSFDHMKRSNGSEVSSSGQPASTVTTVMVDSLVNEVGVENLNFFGGTPFRRSVESPSAWKSPWYFSSLVSCPRFESDITIEDIGIFMSPGERTVDAIGLMKQINDQGADTYADAREVLGTETPESILRQRCSKKLNLEGKSSDVSDNQLKGRLHVAPTVMTERRVLDFSECETPVKSMEKMKCGGAPSLSSSSCLLKGFR